MILLQYPPVKENKRCGRKKCKNVFILRYMSTLGEKSSVVIAIRPPSPPLSKVALKDLTIFTQIEEQTQF